MPDTQTNVSQAHVWNALTACGLSASKDTMLPILCAVQVTREGDKLTFRSTDRFRLTRVDVTLDSPGEDFAAVVSTDDAKRITTMLGKPPARAHHVLPIALYVEDGCLVAYLSGNSVRAPLMEGSFPKTDQLITEDVTATDSVSIAPKYLADLAKMPGRHRNEPVNLAFNGPTKPILSTWGDDGIAYTTIIMPVRQQR